MIVLWIHENMSKIWVKTFSWSAKMMMSCAKLGSTWAWKNNLKPHSIMSFYNLYVKLVWRFSIVKPSKRSLIELFGVTQLGEESTKVYLKRFNEEMLKIEKLIQLVALEALINGVNEHFLWNNLYALSNRILLKVK